MTKTGTNRDIPILISSVGFSPRFHEMQCDCACEVATPKVCHSFPDYPNEKYVLNEPFLSVPLDKDNFVAIGKYSRPMVLNGAGLDVVDHFKHPIRLDEILTDCNGSLENALSCFLKKLIDENVIISNYEKTPSVLDAAFSSVAAWLHITDQCNMRCKYCYLPHNKEHMSVNTGRAAIDSIFRSAATYGFAKVKLKYGGGEPLLFFETIKNLHTYGRKLARKYRIELEGVILTNGMLIDSKTLSFISLNDLRLMISLDGIAEFNDRHRLEKNGGGTFKKVAHAIELSLSHQIIPDISVTISNHNAEGIPELTTWLLERDLPFKYNLFRENKHSSSNDMQCLEENIIARNIRKAFKIIESNIPKRSLLASLGDHANFFSPHLRTCAAMCQYLAYDCNGRISKCQMDFSNVVSNLFDANPLQTIRKSNKGLMNYSVDEKTECNICKWRYWCGGGCPIQTFRAFGSYNSRSPNCAIYRALFPDIIRLEGKRLLSDVPKPQYGKYLTF